MIYVNSRWVIFLDLEFTNFRIIFHVQYILCFYEIEEIFRFIHSTYILYPLHLFTPAPRTLIVLSWYMGGGRGTSSVHGGEEGEHTIQGSMGEEGEHTIQGTWGGGRGTYRVHTGYMIDEGYIQGTCGREGRI